MDESSTSQAEAKPEQQLTMFEEVAARCAPEAFAAAQRQALKEVSKLPREPRVQLPLWPDSCRAAPAAILRSALFGIVARGKRRTVRHELLAAWKGFEIRYTGDQLDQADLDSWLQVLHIVRRYPLGREARFTARGFLHDLGRNNTGNSHRWLERSISRLQACGVNISTDSIEYQGPLVEYFARDKVSGRWVVSVNPKLARLFDEAYVRLSMQQRQQLKSDLARWLQGYVLSHQATKTRPHRIHIERLRELSGSASMARLRRFREQLVAALNELVRVLIVTRFDISNDGTIVEWVRQPVLLPIKASGPVTDPELLEPIEPTPPAGMHTQIF